MQSKVNMELSSSIKTTLADGLCRSCGQRGGLHGGPEPVLGHGLGYTEGNRAAPWDRDREARTGRNMVERVFNRMKHHRKAATRYDGLDEAFRADPRLILIVIYLKNAAKNPTSVNIGEEPVISHRQFSPFPVVAAAGCAGYGSLLWF